MKNKKFILFIILILSISIFSSGCVRRVNEKIGEKIFEKGLEKALGQDVKIDSKGNNLSISTEEEGLEIGENLDWPSKKMDPLPKPKANVVSIVDQQAYENTIAVTVNFSSQKDAEKYLDQIKDLGYIEISTAESSEFFGFVGYNKDNSQVSFNTFQSDELTSAVISLSRDNDQVKDYFAREDEEDEIDFSDLDLTDDVDWPKDKMGSIPELEGKIVGVSIAESAAVIELKYVKKDDMEAYVKTLKKLGFDENSTESNTYDSIFYMGSNDKGDFITLSWDKTNTSIMYTKAN